MKSNLEDIYESFRSFEHYNETYELYCRTVETKWQYTQYKPYKKETLKEPRRIYIHYYYNIDKAAEEEKAFDKKLMALRRELESGKRIPEHEDHYKKYFDVKTTPKRGTKATVREDVVLQAKKYFGFFVFLTNETMDAVTALEIYRNKDLVEKAFGNLKERLNLRRTLVSSEQSLDGHDLQNFII